MKLDNFINMMTGHFNNKEQFDNMQREGKTYPYAEHINTICNEKILNLPKDFNGFATRNNVQRSKVALERAKLNLDQQNLDVERTVFTAYSDASSAKESYEAAETTLSARKLSFEYAKARYEVGLINVFDFNQAQTLLVNAQSEVLRTKYDYIFRTKILEFYFGIPLIKKQ
jgi:outer membrane protein